MNRSTALTSIVLTVALLSASFPAVSDEVSEVNRLHRSGQTSQALQRADQFLSAKPDDAPMRFLRGVMLADSQRGAEATDVFLKLTLDHPELAESHNNLAALHAAAGDYDKARSALEQALRANPNYATAHENLGDVYAMLASQAYSRAAKLDPGNSTLRPKIALVRELFTAKGGTSVPRVKALQ
jgi:tetratricopeptide (TPR) repeat protein